MTLLKSRARAHTRYRLSDGSQVPGATTIAGMLDKSRFLVPWANRLGLEGIDATKYRDASADVGTAAHRLVQAEWDGDDYNTVRTELSDQYGEEIVGLAENSALSYYEWAKGHTINPIFSEQQMVSERYRFGGTCDLYAVI